MYVYTKDTVVSHIDTVDTKENTYIKGLSSIILYCLLFTLYMLCMSKVSKEAQNAIRMKPLCPFMYTQIR